jgi:hypothetical protein
MAENISPELLDRINQFALAEPMPNQGMDMMPQGFQEGGEVEQMMMAGVDPNAELAAAIDGLMAEQAMTDDPTEQAMFESMAENVVDAANAPMADMVQMIAAEGRGGDTTLAHLTPGEVVLPVAAMQDPQFETAVENRFNEIGLDPEQYVVGAGIASLNPMTGLEEFGFFKKVGKFLKKAVKVVAPIAMLVPGVGTAVGAALGGIGGLAAKIPVVGEALGAVGSKVAGGIAGLGIPGISPIAGGALEGSADFLGTLKDAAQKPLSGGIFGELGSTYQGGPMAGEGLANRLGLGSGTPTQLASDAEAREAIDTLDQMTDEQKAANPEVVQMLKKTAEGTVGRLEKALSFGLGDSIVGGKGGLPGLMGMLGLGGKGDLGKLGLAGGAAYMLGKLAKEEAERDKGVPMVPLTTMDASGRYNIEAEIARRMGRQAPNPVEFGLQPRFPTMVTSSTGPARVSQYYDPSMPDYDPSQVEQVPVRGAANGGAIYPMAYANGGNVAMEDFERMNGGIDGPGTETSDDIPAMLSDGEFVMTGQAVRGAGSFELNEQPDGILALVPSSSEDRERGTQLMYQMMNAFERYANATN